MNESKFKAKYLKYKQKYLYESLIESLKYIINNKISYHDTCRESSYMHETKKALLQKVTNKELSIHNLLHTHIPANQACPPPMLIGEPATPIIVKRIGSVICSRIFKGDDNFIRMLWSGYEQNCQHFACHLADYLNAQKLKCAAIEQTTLSAKWLEYGNWDEQGSKLLDLYRELDSQNKVNEVKKQEYAETTRKYIWDVLSKQWASMKGFRYNIIIIPPDLDPKKTLCRIEWPEIIKHPKAQVCIIRYNSINPTQCEIIIPPDRSITVSEQEPASIEQVFFDAEDFNYLLR